MDKKVEYARRCFAHNRAIAEKEFAHARDYAKQMRDDRHGRAPIPFGIRTICHLPYLWEKPKVFRILCEYRWKVRFYRKIETDLDSGDLTSAIEALSIFCPREETASEVVQRVRKTPATISAALSSPGVLCTNMLRLRDDLMRIQSGQYQ